ncbi:MAG: ComEC/Rec2 family competence protein [Actinomycetota bacterium]|nr:ComEC/Rec2 family competence protein [Actinomycetota bacterium]
MRLGRIWLAVAALGAGTAHGCGRDPSELVFMLALCGAALVLLRSRRARALGVVAIAVGLGSVGAGWRCAPHSALTVVAERAPFCDFSGRVLEGAGGLGTLAKLSRIDCRDWGAVLDPGVAVLDGTVGVAGSSLSGRGWLLPLGADGFERARARVGAQAALDPTELHLRAPASGPHALAAGARHNLEAVTRPLEPTRAALLRGLVVGDTERLDPGLLDAFRRAGLSHLLAVSGSNVAIVVGAVALILRPAGLVARVAGGAAALGLYLLVVGPEPSVLRAALMGSIALVALAAGTRTDPLAALGVAVLVLVSLRPGLVYSVGLHLSVAATAGIVLWAGPIAGRSGGLPRLVSVPLGVSIAAQAAVAPILVGTFGELSLAAPAANLLAAPAVPPATVLGLAAALAHGLHPAAGTVLARLAEPWAAWIVWVGEVFGAQSWAALALPKQAALALGALAVAAVWITLRVTPPQ